MREFSEGDNEFLLCYEISATIRSRKHCSSWYYSLKIPFIVALFNEITDTIRLDTIH